MGFGDNLMASGMARGASLRGKKIAFGDGRRILWDQHSKHIFQNNPNIATPGDEQRHDLEWIHHYKGLRLYNKQVGGKFVWNYDFVPKPGQIYFTENEESHGRRNGRGFVVIEPNLPRWKVTSYNKDWGIAKYQAVATWLKQQGIRVTQFVYGHEPVLRDVSPLETKSFRDAVAVLGSAWLYVGPEGGLHHGAAAMGTPGVVLFGGFIPPSVTGYKFHTNLSGTDEPCGNLNKCEHCRAAMAAISVDQVTEAARSHLRIHFG